MKNSTALATTVTTPAMLDLRSAERERSSDGALLLLHVGAENADGSHQLPVPARFHHRDRSAMPLSIRN